MVESTLNDEGHRSFHAGFFHRHVALVRQLCHRRGVLEYDVDDVVQRVFIIIFSKLDRIQAGAERAFVIGVTLRETAHCLRTYARRAEVPDDSMPPASSGEPRLDEQVHLRRLVEGLRRRLGCLDEGARQVWLLHEVEGVHCRMIARRLELPVGTVKTRLRRARQALQRQEAVER